MDKTGAQYKLPEGHAAIVVGGSGTIGSAVTHALVAGGARVVSLARRAHDTPSGAVSRTIDVLDPALKAAVHHILEDDLAGRLDTLVWCAGTLGVIGPTRSVRAADMRRLYDEHVTSLLVTIGGVSTALDASDNASVVAFSGGGATDAFPRYTPYAAAKAALVRVVENLAAEEPHWRVNAVAPGFVASQMHEVTLSAGPEAAGDYFAETQRRLEKAVSPQVAAGLVLFLAHPESAGITGRLISAPWDPWKETRWLERLRETPSLGRLRRIDDQWYVDVRDGA